jgi:formylglycine-generating enzyme
LGKKVYNKKLLRASCLLILSLLCVTLESCKKDEPVSVINPPAAPALESVENGANDQSLPPALSWGSVNGATNYTLQIATDTAFKNIVVNKSGITATGLSVSDLSYLTTYYWHVCASNAGGNSAYSKTWSFSTKAVDMISIPGNTFIMGGVPSHSVTLSSYRISSTEITQRQWFAIMGTNPSSHIGDNYPLEQISWYQAVAFCNKLSIQQGKPPCYSINGNTAPADWSNGTIQMNRTGGYRLPTEAEWEYAARGGQSTHYSGTNDDAMLPDYAWYFDNATNTMPVGKRLPNAYGLYDMTGNVWEWCWDWYAAFTSDAQTDPTGPATGSYKSLRGGAWSNSKTYCIDTYRLTRGPITGYDYFGLRVVQD